MAIPTIRSEVKALFVFGVWIAFGCGYFERFPLPGAFSKLFLLATAGIITLSAFGLGSLLAKPCKKSELLAAEFALLSTLIGFSALSLAMVAFGVFGLWTRVAGVLLVALGLPLAWQERQTLKTIGDSLHTMAQRPFVPLFLIALGATLSLLIAFAPPTYYDTLVYHYRLPQDYLQAGRWVGQTQLIYSAFPQVMEMIWTLGMLLGGDLLANLLGWAIAALGLWAVYLYTKRFIGEETGIWAVALVAVMPSYLLLSSGGYIDVGLTVFSFMSFYTLCLWLKKKNTTLLLLSGALAGTAIGCKYTGAVPLAIGLILLIKEGLQENAKSTGKIDTLSVIARRSNERPTKQSIMTDCFAPLAMTLFLYLFSALIVFLPWMIKNLHYVGNPVFPFFYKCNLKPLNPWVQEAASGYFRGLTEYSPRTFLGLFELVWDAATRGLQFGGGMDILGDLGWGLLFAFLPVLWLSKKLPQAVKFLLLYALLFFIPWGLSRPVLRFLLPIAPFLAIASAYGYKTLTASPGFLRVSGYAFLSLLLMSNFALFFEVTDSLSLFKVPLGFESREAFLSNRLRYYSAARFLDRLPENSLTYVIGDQSAYYYNRPVLITPVFNSSPITAWANDAASSTALAEHLRAEGITHLLLNYTELNRIQNAYALLPFSPEGRSRWEDLLKRRTTSLYRDKHCEVLAL